MMLLSLVVFVLLCIKIASNPSLELSSALFKASPIFFPKIKLSILAITRKFSDFFAFTASLILFENP